MSKKFYGLKQSINLLRRWSTRSFDIRRQYLNLKKIGHKLHGFSAWHCHECLHKHDKVRRIKLFLRNACIIHTLELEEIRWLKYGHNSIVKELTSKTIFLESFRGTNLVFNKITRGKVVDEIELFHLGKTDTNHYWTSKIFSSRCGIRKQLAQLEIYWNHNCSW